MTLSFGLSWKAYNRFGSNIFVSEISSMYKHD